MPSRGPNTCSDVLLRSLVLDGPARSPRARAQEERLWHLAPIATPNGPHQIFYQRLSTARNIIPFQQSFSRFRRSRRPWGFGCALESRIWWAQQDLNLRPLPCEGSALAAEPCAHLWLKYTTTAAAGSSFSASPERRVHPAAARCGRRAGRVKCCFPEPPLRASRTGRRRPAERIG